MALDESKEGDKLFEIDGHSFVINKELLAEAAPVLVDFTEMGFKVDTSMEFDESGCGGCSSAGSC